MPRVAARDDVLLLAERCSGTSAIGNGLAYCRAIERALGIELPPRAQTLRAFFAELERLRHHMTSIREICGSTSLTVAASQALRLEEQLLRISGETAGHRYLFGLLAIGGLTRDYADSALKKRPRCAADGVASQIDALAQCVGELEQFPRPHRAGWYCSETRGPVRSSWWGRSRARAAVAADMRKIQPYGAYPGLDFDVPTEAEGDGYARLRVLFAEMRQSLRLMPFAM